jgi:hypothetical protein
MEKPTGPVSGVDPPSVTVIVKVTGFPATTGFAEEDRVVLVGIWADTKELVPMITLRAATRRFIHDSSKRDARRHCRQ